MEELRPFRIVEPFENNQTLSKPFTSLVGTRHISGAQFVYDQPGTISIVASTDGNVTFFTKEADGSGILAIQQAEMALLHEGLGGSLWNLSLFSEMGWLEPGGERKERNYLSTIIRWMRSTLKN